MNNLKQTPWADWEIIDIIGRGSFGAVYKIQRKLVDDNTEYAALKVISIPQNPADIESLRSEGYDDEAITETLKEHLSGIINEYNLTQKLDGHTNIVNSKDIATVAHENGIGWDIFIRMELLTPLMKALPDTVSDDMVIRFGIDICKALQLCRKHNIIHRDIKPQNIFVSENGDYKLGDFGIAKEVEKTVSGTKIGTYKYMAPEVYYSQPYGQSADVYSLGLVLYWMLNDRRMPFMPLPPTKITTSVEEESRRRRLSGEPLSPPAHGREALKQVVLKACAYHPKDRYASVDELLADLNAMVTGTYVMKTDSIDIQNGEDGTTGPMWLVNDERTTGPDWKKSPEKENGKKKKKESHPSKKVILPIVLAALAIIVAGIVIVFSLSENTGSIQPDTIPAASTTNNTDSTTPVSTKKLDQSTIATESIVNTTQLQVNEQPPLTAEKAEHIIQKARTVVLKWLTGAGYSTTNTIKIGDYSYGLVPYTKAEMKAEFNTCLHNYYFEDLFAEFYVEKNGKIYYKIVGFGGEGCYTFIKSELKKMDSGYMLTAHGISYDALGGTQYDEMVIDHQFEFVLQDGNWVIKGIDGEFSEGSYWMFDRYHFISEKALYFPETLIAPQEAFLDTFGNEDGMSVNMRSGPGTNNSIIKKIPDNAKLYVCGTSEAYPDWVFVCYLGDYGWVIKSCVFGEDVLTEGNIIFRFEEAHSLKLDWLDSGRIAIKPISHTIDGKEYKEVWAYGRIDSVDSIKEEFAQCFSKDLYEAKIDSLYTMIGNDLYCIDDFEDFTYVQSEKATLKIISQTKNECSFTVTVYPEDTSMSPITNTYKLKKVNDNWIFVEQFECVNTYYNFDT